MEIPCGHSTLRALFLAHLQNVCLENSPSSLKLAHLGTRNITKKYLVGTLQTTFHAVGSYSIIKYVKLKNNILDSGGHILSLTDLPTGRNLNYDPESEISPIYLNE